MSQITEGTSGNPEDVSSTADGLEQARTKMQQAGVYPAAIETFAAYYRQLSDGVTGVVEEASITPLPAPASLDDIDLDPEEKSAALAQVALIRLNGGLGTSMGMAGPKSLLPVRGEATFLDVIVQQVLGARKTYDVAMPLVLMNSFRTRQATLDHLRQYPDLPVDGIDLDFLQSQEPKLLTADLCPAQWPEDPELEWTPPGHGDLYPSLRDSGMLASLVERGFRYACVANVDNLGATPSPEIAAWFASSGAPFAIEVCRRTVADRKGGHLAIRTTDGRIILRESAQVRDDDADAFGDITRHSFFNTNNLWLDLQALATLLDERDGVLGLPMIVNRKTVDPSNAASPAVIQIETAMGSAIEAFDGAQVIEVPRSRFLPVKTTNDLLVLRSDLYELDSESQLQAVTDEATNVDLDPEFYKLIKAFDDRFPSGPPSLVEASEFIVRGDWKFGAEVKAAGAVRLDPPGGVVADGTELR